MRSEILKVSQDLIRFKTVDGNPTEFSRAADYVRGYFHNVAGIYTTAFSFEGTPAFIISNHPDTKRFDILFNGHLDVVAAQDEDFTPKIKNGSLYGRGAADMKTMVAVCMVLMKQLAVHNTTKRIGLMIVFDEEVGGFHGTAKLVGQGYCGNVVIIPDDMGAFQMTIKEKGIVGVDVVFTGKPAHSCEPWKGSSAVDQFLDFSRELRHLFPVPAEEAWVTTCNIGPIKADHPRNQLAPELTISLDIRHTEDTNAKEIHRRLRGLARQHGAIIRPVFDGPVVLTPLTDPSIQAFKKIAERTLGHDVTTTLDHGASDARHFAAAGCPIIMFKPPSNGMHGDNESVRITDLEIFYSILEQYCKL